MTGKPSTVAAVRAGLSHAVLALAALRAKAALRAARELRRNWPDRAHPVNPDEATVGVVITSFNTRQVLSWLLFSLFRVLPRKRLARVVVVDNASTDGSAELLSVLSKSGLVDAILNPQQRYHGPALNQGIEHLRAMQARGTDRIDYVWVLDSDTVMLRPDVLDAALAALAASGAAMAGEFQTDVMPEGYAHPSCLLLDPAQVWRRSVNPFEQSGAPAKAMQTGMVRQGLKRLDFPFMAGNFVLHLGESTLRAVWEHGTRDNAYYRWANAHHEPHYHGNPSGRPMHEEFLAAFEREGAEGDIDAFRQSLTPEERIVLTTPYLPRRTDAAPIR